LTEPGLRGAAYSVGTPPDPALAVGIRGGGRVSRQAIPT
jgi:hypothetical protein